jgi:hypothetical protein
MSSYLWLRNHYLVPILESDSRHARLSNEDMAKLRGAVAEIDELHGTLSGTVDLTRTHTVINEESGNPERSGELFETLHDVLKNYRVRPDLYRRLGGAFKELGLTPEGDIAEAIHFGEIRSVHARSDDAYLWKHELKTIERRRGLAS